MSPARWLIVWLIAVLALGTWGLSQATKPAATPVRVKKEPKAPPPRRYQIGQPWARLTTLTDEQKAKIEQIRRATETARKALMEREKEDILALLNDEQKAEYEKLMEAQGAARLPKAEAATRPATSQAAEPVDEK